MYCLSSDCAGLQSGLGAALRLDMNERWHVNLGVEYHHDVSEVSERAFNGRLQINYAFQVCSRHSEGPLSEARGTEESIFALRHSPR